MKIQFSKRGNGACPVCKKRENCTIRSKMKEALKSVTDIDSYGMEAVIYTCPLFDEDFNI